MAVVGAPPGPHVVAVDKGPGEVVVEVVAGELLVVDMEIHTPDTGVVPFQAQMPNITREQTCQADRIEVTCQKEGNGGIHTRFMRSRIRSRLTLYIRNVSSHTAWLKTRSETRTPSTAGSSCTLRRGGGSSTAKSFTSEARKMMYWYGS